ncbi:S-adenosyl-L-methionine-dependent methyltransferase [Xylariomycetidae sp. FL0641]|nr:S-adenosyl-L-methionine-dependent methyltransferase [Xylariomycetidae sp. FL0641]
MTQNIYDDPTFLAKFRELTRTVGAAPNGVPDLAQLETLLPPLRGAAVLDLGCGEGWFSRWAAAHGAGRVHGVDGAASMLARARADSQAYSDIITYAQGDLNRPAEALAALPGGGQPQFDLAFSSLALHYLTDLPGLFGAVHGALKPGAAFVFSVEHPMRTASRTAGAATDRGTGRPFWPVADYADEGARVTDWLLEGVVKQHYTLQTYLGGVLDAGFEVTLFREWAQRDTGGRFEGERWSVPSGVMPAFLMVGTRKRREGACACRM